MSDNLRDLQKRLAVVQREIKDAQIPVLILLEGWENSGKGSMIRSIIREMDPRSFAVKVFERETEEESRKPFLWRFWRDIPPKGHFRIFDRSHYLSMMNPPSLKENLFPQDINDIWAFEKQLTDDGTILIKFFLEVSKKEQGRRIKKLEKTKYSAFRVSDTDRHQQKHYEDYERLFDTILEETDFDFAPWQIIDSEDKDTSQVLVLSTILEKLEEVLQKKNATEEVTEKTDITQSIPDVAVSENSPKPENMEESTLPQEIPSEEYTYSHVLSSIDLSKKLEKEDYKKQLKKLQKKARKLSYKLYVKKIPVVIAFEGWDAAGKGGAIKRLTQKIDPRGYEVIPIAAPDATEKQHHYMWRFYKHLPKTGHMRIFDRSWYGRVMVERIEGFATQEEWSRAYDEINQNEEHLAGFGTLILKFFLHIDKDEQLSRFNARQNDPEKSYKLTDEDWRNREKWDDYQEAIGEMISRTNKLYAPWIIVEGNDKYYARVKVLSAFVEAAKNALEQ